MTLAVHASGKGSGGRSRERSLVKQSNFWLAGIGVGSGHRFVDICREPFAARRPRHPPGDLMANSPAYTIYQPDADLPQPGDVIECHAIGIIHTPYKTMDDCPSRHNKNDYLPCTIALTKEYAPGIAGFKAGDKALVLYWLHLARRDMVELPVRAGVRERPVGVFTTRTPPRPNPIAASVVEVTAVREGALEVTGLDCLDGTPLLDIKRSR
jgi:tRNA-Thr(GGU) m(6)t(6)A37 methyltransferase TsaA